MKRSLALLLFSIAAVGPIRADDPPTRRVAAAVTEYRHNSHADVIVSRLLLTDTLDGKGEESPLKLAALYTDQKPENDISRLLAASQRFPIEPTIGEALTLGTGKLAVEGVLLVAEHGDYPFSSTGNHQYPKRRFWDETARVFRHSGRGVPVFIDKHLSDNWADARAIYDEARELKVPLMAGSSVPGTWRRPAADVDRDAPIDEIVMLTYGTTDAYGFHGLEVLQALAEQRRGGETGVRAVQCLAGDEAWKAIDAKKIDPELFQSALGRALGFEHGETLNRKAVPEPKLMMIEYQDGLKAAMVELNGAIGTWSGAWRYRDDRRVESTRFETQEARPAGHFSLLLDGIEKMMLTGVPTWPVERTLLTSGTLDALLQSLSRGGVRVETPYLNVAYQPTWRWKQPAPMPPGRPWAEQ
ncbi:hypothetical protein P12x_002966 [Tundrisphaera lichenicola]|uniref:hypothetical protein n=1 Tax=Tundrisphaera lichenicola TaxID=2029860 RepID=UPI003EB87675